MTQIVNSIRFTIIKILWKIPRIARRYCWARAVTWSLGYRNDMLEPASHECYYCFACNTDEEIERYISSHDRA